MHCLNQLYGLRTCGRCRWEHSVVVMRQLLCVCDWPSLDIAEIWLADNDDLQGEMIIAVK